MKVTIKPSILKGIIQAPASKSSMQRALAAALLSKGTSIIHNPGHSNDDKAALGIIKALGASVEIINEDDIPKLLKKKAPVAYCGYEPSGEIHLGHLVTITKDFRESKFASINSFKTAPVRSSEFPSVYVELVSIKLIPDNKAFLRASLFNGDLISIL